jgi:hypothetical protein
MTETLDETRARIRAFLSGPGKTSRWLTKNLDYEDADWCLIYPFAWEDGAYPKYRSTSTGMRNVVIHRMMCEYRHGLAPTPKHHSAHCCDRGVEGCVNPMHVSWKTAAQNQLDKKIKGLATSRKISPEAANQILARKGIDRPIDLARQFNVSLRNVRLIHGGQAWKSEWFRGRRVFTADEVIAIRKLKGVVMMKDVAEQYGANWSQISRIMNRQTYNWVGESVDEVPRSHSSLP